MTSGFENGITMDEAPDEVLEVSDVAFLAPELVAEAEGPMPIPARVERRLTYRFVKRAFDIVFSLCVIAVLLVPSLLLCLAIRIESPGNPIYSQKRVGRIGRGGEVETFDMYKFRSMYKDADERLADLKDLNEADGPLFKIKDDPRVTRIGRFIRKHSIDELPQFLNCLLGQISCVGPRPPLPSEVAQYDGRAMRRLSVKPGLTGYWQVSGRSDTSFGDMVDQDLWILGPSNCTPLKLHVTLDDVQVAEREQTEPPHVLEGLEPVARPLLHLDGAVGASAPSSVPDIAPICRRRGLLRAARGELLPLPLPA